jgi:hypothetical protein
MSLERVTPTALTFTFSIGPATLDEREDGSDFPFAEPVLKGRHVALISWDHGCHSLPGDQEKLRVAVMPAVAGLVVRRRWHAAIWKWLPPVRLALEFGTVAGGAVISVNSDTRRQLLPLDGALSSEPSNAYDNSDAADRDCGRP